MARAPQQRPKDADPAQERPPRRPEGARRRPRPEGGPPRNPGKPPVRRKRPAGKRPRPRESGELRAQGAPRAETVATTLTQASQAAASAAAAGARGAEATRDLLSWLLPLVGQGLLVVGSALGRAARWTGEGLWSRRVGLFRASHRVMWWAALVLMAVAGRALLSGHEVGPVVDHAHLLFGVGLGLCLFVLAFAAEQRLRVAALVLGGGHGAMAVLAWSLLSIA